MRYYQIKELLDLKPDSQSVTLKGWVKTFRSNRFISLNDGSSQQSIQCVVDFENTDPKILQKIKVLEKSANQKIAWAKEFSKFLKRQSDSK